MFGIVKMNTEGSIRVWKILPQFRVMIHTLMMKAMMSNDNNIGTGTAACITASLGPHGGQDTPLGGGVQDWDLCTVLMHQLPIQAMILGPG